MKRIGLLIFILCCSCQITLARTSLVFGVKPGVDVNAAYAGINQGNLVPYLGVDMSRISATGSYLTTDDAIQTIGSVVYRSLEFTTTDFDASAFLLVPHLGVKLFVGSQLARPYLFGDVFVSLPAVKLEAHGTREQWDYRDNVLIDHHQENITHHTADIQKAIKDLVSFWGFCVGAGAEYFFNPHFSIGGEYGIRVLFDSAEYQHRNEDFLKTSYPSDKFKNQWQAEVSASFQVSYAVVSVNFYF